MKTMVVNAVVNGVIPVITLALTALISFGCAYLKSKTTKIKAESERNLLTAAISEAEAVAEKSVAATAQTLTDSLKASSANGKLTPAQAGEALAKAKECLMSSLSNEAKELLMTKVDDVEKYIETVIESKIKALKTATAVKS